MISNLNPDIELEQELKSIQSQLPVQPRLNIKDSGRTLEIFLEEGVEITLPMIGRLLTLNGHYRNQGIKLVIHSEERIVKQLKDNGLDRLIWLETHPPNSSGS